MSSIVYWYLKIQHLRMAYKPKIENSCMLDGCN